MDIQNGDVFEGHRDYDFGRSVFIVNPKTNKWEYHEIENFAVNLKTREIINTGRFFNDDAEYLLERIQKKSKYVGNIFENPKLIES